VAAAAAQHRAAVSRSLAALVRVVHRTGLSRRVPHGTHRRSVLAVGLGCPYLHSGCDSGTKPDAQRHRRQPSQIPTRACHAVV
jgi:hypothetical protein